jgi:hypothetical protein
MKKPMIIMAAALAVAAPTGWYFGSPYLAMHQLKEAVKSGDRDELAERVDFPAVRESIKSQMKAVMMAEVAKQKESNPFSALGGMLAMAMVDPIIDGMVSPDGLKSMVDKGKVAAKPDQATSDQPDAKWDISHRGFGKFTAKPENDDGRVPKLVFKRDGLGWRLVDIEMPVGGLDGGATPTNSGEAASEGN